ncbi:potassium-transporting ATPase subunit KdpC [Fictibacillus barbaricus]|uniref:Potassium-transporting ATPase KdpC subunit n=1 Tax=Fictibacillus barbaricus TaxID=182136 RepID=A0ABU1TX27_9BACL|nr:potassium-transporting ATPase subunit KdpC [Fictibacillus barbaricus]MDR7071742.1 K+-transporting ATPase ATPase C chain [Fictibacillus barbaricus]
MFKIVRLSLLMIVLCGIIYPLAMTGIAQAFFPSQANGSLIKNSDGKVVGSELIGQNYKSPQYFQGRVSSIENNGAATGSNNYAPSNEDMLKRIKDSINALKKENPELNTKDIPVDLITNSGSGLDPHISVKAAEFQVDRISKETGIAKPELLAMIKDSTENRSLGVFGEPRVNVLKLNMKVHDAIK